MTRKGAKGEKLLIKRYASRRLYNAETSDYVTLEDIARFIREGRDVEIVDLKSGEDLTRQYLLQIIAEHEGRGENVLPVEVLTDLVRAYTSQAQSVVPQFLAMSFEMLREGQSKMMENMGSLPNPLAQMPGFEAMQAQQQAFLKAMMGGWSAGRTEAEMPGNAPAEAAGEAPGTKGAPATPDAPQKHGDRSELDDIRQQLAELQARLSSLD